MAQRFLGEPAWEDTPYEVLARLCARTASGAASPVESEGTLLNQSDISSISCKVYDPEGTLIVQTTPVVSDAVYNTLQTTGVFSRMPNGGNFVYKIPATAFPTGDTTNTAEITLTLGSGELVRAVWTIPVLNLNQS